MELSHKTTILLSADLHRRLTSLARERRQSLGELVRDACRRQYGLVDRVDRLAAVAALAELQLPVGPVDAMIRESVAQPRDLPT